jgi:sugar phosphate isomerase/epimerase
LAQVPKFSVGQYTTPHLSFAEDLRTYVAAGATGIGIDAGLKLRGEEDDLALFEESPLRATYCFPSVPSVLPSEYIPGPERPQERIRAMCQGISDLAPYKPLCCVCLPGPIGSLTAREARGAAIRGLREAARVAADLDLRLALEPMHASLRDTHSFVNTIPAAAELISELDVSNVGILVDVWHLWDTEDLLTEIRQCTVPILGAHLNDRRRVTRSWCDRVLPGDGVADLVGIVSALRARGFDEWYELEIFSDDGTFGAAFPDSLWKVDPSELIVEGHAKLMEIWGQSVPDDD